MQTSGQTRTLGTVARAALIARGHLLEDGEEQECLEGFGVPAPIPEEDRKDLKRYFSEERTKDHSGGGSNFNAMLDRMGLYAKVSVPCKACGGLLEKWDEETGELITAEKAGSGFVRDSKAFRDWEQIESLCGRPTDAQAVRSWLKVNNRAVSESGELLDHGDYWCSACKGRGWVTRNRKDPKRPPDVQVTGQTPVTPPSPKVGDSEVLSLLGRVGRKRAALRAADPLAEAVLSVEFSPDGGTLVALWHLTLMGRRLLQGNELGRPHQAYFQSLQIAQSANQDPQRARQFEIADRQAQALRHRMRRVWHEVHG